MNQELSIWGYFEKCVKDNYANFEGRARRKEYWSYTLVVILLHFCLNIVCGILAAMADAPMLALLPFLAGVLLFLPGLGVVVRRLHDVGRSGFGGI